MADALCGPSNPLQTFQKHTQADRTLQQDRLTGRHTPGSGFRSYDPRTGSLDAEFARFEAGHHPDQFLQPVIPDHILPAPRFYSPITPSASSWAADFSKLHISSPQIAPEAFINGRLKPQATLSGWQNDFMNQIQHASSQVTNGQTSTTFLQMYNSTYQQPYTPMFQQSYQPQYDLTYNVQPTIAEQKQANRAPLNALSEEDFQHEFEAFEREAELAQRSLEQQEHQMNGGTHEDPAYMDDTVMSERGTGISGLDQIRIGSDLIEPKEVQDTRQDADDLANIARTLLSQVQHDESPKFAASEFMALMRQVRDREVEVRGDNFESTKDSPAVPAASVNFNAARDTMHDGIHDMIQDRQNPVQADSTLFNDFRPHDPNTFQFPDMNSVYAGDPAAYGFDDDQFPPLGSLAPQTIGQPAQSQIQELHPGGPYYPSPPMTRDMMSGGIQTNVGGEPWMANAGDGSGGSGYQPPSVADEDASFNGTVPAP